MIRSLFQRLRRDAGLPVDKYDLIVCGHSLSAYIALYAACMNHLRVAWLTNSTEHENKTTHKPTPGFDSLAPEGVHFLRHLVSQQKLQGLSLGTFSGIHRAEGYSEFDSALGQGIQIKSQQLKQYLLQQSEAHITELHGEVLGYTLRGDDIEIQTKKQAYRATWLINAEGEHSRLSSQPVNVLSEAIWITRKMTNAHTAQRNQVSFETSADGWQWNAADRHGQVCSTRWQRADRQTEPPTQAFNAKWYRRQQFYESQNDAMTRVLLAGPGCFRFDPACGLGMTIQIKSAMLAIRCIMRAREAESDTEMFIRQYCQQMESTCNDISQNMIPFYRSYGMSFQLT